MEPKSVDHGRVHGAVEGASMHMSLVDKHMTEAKASGAKPDAGYLHNHLQGASAALHDAVQHVKDVIERPFGGPQPGQIGAGKAAPVPHKPDPQPVHLVSQGLGSHISDIVKYAAGSLVAIVLFVGLVAHYVK